MIKGINSHMPAFSLESPLFALRVIVSLHPSQRRFPVLLSPACLALGLSGLKKVLFSLLLFCFCLLWF